MPAEGFRTNVEVNRVGLAMTRSRLTRDTVV
jgi:hypothetical protein